MLDVSKTSIFVLSKIQWMKRGTTEHAASWGYAVCEREVVHTCPLQLGRQAEVEDASKCEDV